MIHQRSAYAIWTSVILSLFFIRCVEPLDIDIPESPPVLVVEGMITDLPGPYQVRISQSKPINSKEPFIRVAGAKVSVEEENGVTATFREDTTGVYVSDSTALQGKAGARYRLNIQLADGKTYISDWETLKPSPPINDIDFVLEERLRERGTQKGIQFYLDTKDSENNTRYYRWEWEATWVHGVPYPESFIFLGNDSTTDITPHTICWEQGFSSNINIATSSGNSTDEIADFPLLFVSTYGVELRLRYSLLARQFAISEKEYFFWKSLQESNESTGTLFDRQPQIIRANIYNQDNEEEVVLGYFSVAGASEKRVYVSRTELPKEINIGEAFLASCITNTDTFFKPLETERDVFQALSFGMIFFNFYRNPDIRGWIVTTEECSDCRARGGTTKRPDWWQ